MKTRLHPEAAVDGVAELAKRTSQLSHTLFDIAAGLVVDVDSDSSIPQSICDTAHEFADIAQLCMEVCTLLGDKKLHRINTDAGAILGRLDILLREFEDALVNFVPKKVPRWLTAWFRNENTYMMTKCHSVKEPLCLLLSVLRIADVHRPSNKTYVNQHFSNLPYANSVRTHKKKRRRKDENAVSMAIECACAESWVETNRQVIKVLMNAERRLQKGFPRELLQLSHWTESSGATAMWMYNLILDKVLGAQLDGFRSAARGPRVKTIRTSDGSGPASDSEHDDDTELITPEMERNLDQSPVRSQVINELLERWTGLDFKVVREIAESQNRGRSRFQDAAPRVIKSYQKNERMSNESSSPPAEANGQRKMPSLMALDIDHVGEDLSVPAPTPPGSPKPSMNQPGGSTKKSRSTHDNDHPAEEDMGEDWGTIIGGKSREKQKGKSVVGEEQVSTKDTSKPFTLDESRMPSVAALEEQNAIGPSFAHGNNSLRSPGATSSILGQFGEEEPNPWVESNLELGRSSKDTDISLG